MHPTGDYGVVFNFGDPLCLDARPVTTPVFLDGANTMTRRLGFLGHIEVMDIRFYEGGAFPFLRIPLIELQNQPNVLDESHDASLLRLYSRLYEARTLPARISLMEGWLMEQLARGTTRSTLIPSAVAPGNRNAIHEMAAFLHPKTGRCSSRQPAAARRPLSESGWHDAGAIYPATTHRDCPSRAKAAEAVEYTTRRRSWLFRSSLFYSRFPVCDRHYSLCLYDA